MIDWSALAFSRGVVIGGAFYALASVVGGQVIGARTIDKIGWLDDCESWIKQSFQNEIDSREEEESLVPKTDCDSVFGTIHPAIRKLCQDLNNPDLGNIGGFTTSAVRDAEQSARDLERRQLETAAKGAGSQCECAAAVYRRENMIGLAVYAGTARLVTLPHVENMTSSLQEALSEPICVNFTGGLG